MSAEKEAQMPKGIALIAIFYVVCALLLFLLGVGAFFFAVVASFSLAQEPTVASSDPTLALFLIGTGAFVFPVALVVVAYGLWKGKKWAWGGTVLLCGINLGILFTLFYSIILSSIVYPSDLLLQVAIICYMFTGRVKNYLSK